MQQGLKPKIQTNLIACSVNWSCHSPLPRVCAAADVGHCKDSTITRLSSLKTVDRNHIKPENLCVTWFVQIVVHWVDDASSSSFSSLDTDFSVMHVLFQRFTHVLYLQIPEERGEMWDLHP